MEEIRESAGNDSAGWPKALGPRLPLPLALQDGTFDFLTPHTRGLDSMDLTILINGEAGKRLRGIWRHVRAMGHPPAPPLPALATCPHMKGIG